MSNLSNSDSESKQSVSDPETMKSEQKSLMTRLRECRGLSVGVICFSSFLGGCSLSILSPFYTKEAEQHGLSVTASGMVFASVFIIQLIFTPIFGLFLQKIGTVRLFICGLLVIGATNMMFGLLPRVESGTGFLALSLIIRSVMAVGEAAVNTSVYPLASSRCTPGREASMTGWVETMLGVGTTIGPFVGGVLFEYGGFFLPFLTVGTLLIILGIAALCVLSSDKDHTSKVNDLEDDFIKGPKLVETFRSALRSPWLVACSCVTLVTGISCQWYQPTLEPFLRDNFKMSSFQSSLFFIVDGGLYAIVTPLVGFILDKGLLPKPCLLVGSGVTSLAFIVLSASAIEPSLALVIVGIGMNGVGMALNYLSTYQMLSSLSVPGLATSLWILAENLGGMIGALGGGAAFESLGWSVSCLFVVAFHCLCLLLMTLLQTSSGCRDKPEKRPLLRSSQRIEIYGSNNNIVIV